MKHGLLRECGRRSKHVRKHVVSLSLIGIKCIERIACKTDGSFREPPWHRWFKTLSLIGYEYGAYWIYAAAGRHMYICRTLFERHFPYRA